MAQIQINEVYLDLYRMPSRYIIAWGGRRSGKSWAISQLLVRRGTEYGPRRIVIMRKVLRTARYSIWPRIQAAVAEVYPPDLYKINRSDFLITLPNGTEIYCLGADDPEKLKSIEGVTDYWMEEATEFTEADFNTIDAGLSTISDWPNQIWMSFNPLPRIPGHQHWIEKRFLQQEIRTGEVVNSDRVSVLHTTFRHNAFCPEETVRTLMKYRDTNPALFEMWADGKFAVLEGVILKNWEIVDAVPDGIPFFGYGLDFGYANDPAALVSIWIKNDDLYVREEMYSTGLTNDDLAERMKGIGITRNEIIRADQAEPKSIEEIRRHGFTIVPCVKGNDYKRFVAQWLQGKNIKVVSGSTNLIGEIATWSWQRTRQGDILPRPADGNDHCIDAMIYGSWTGRPPIPTPAPQLRTQKTRSKVLNLPI